VERATAAETRTATKGGGTLKTRELEKTKHPGIYRRGNRYVVIFRDGTGHQRKQAADTHAHARAVQAEHRLDPGGDTAVSRERFRDYARRWVETCPGRTPNGIRQKTREDYRSLLERDAIPLLGNVRVGDLRPAHLDQLAERVAKRPGLRGAEQVSPATVQMALAPVRALLADALQRGDIKRNSATGWKTRYTRVDREVVNDEDAADVEEKVRALDEDQLAALLAHVPAEWRLFFTFLAQTGLRISEATELRWRDVDLGRKRIDVRRRNYRGTVAPPKSRYGRRTIRLSDNPARELWTRQREPDELVFARPGGHRINRGNLQQRVLSPAAKRAGLVDSRGEPWVTCHVFRHTCASMLFRAGWNAKQVQMTLGHHSPAFTLATYVHLLPDDLPDPSFLDRLEGGNTGATRPPETHLTDDPAVPPDLARNLGAVRAV
jgi:integrase